MTKKQPKGNQDFEKWVLRRLESKIQVLRTGDQSINQETFKMA